MYLPAALRITDWEVVAPVIRAHPFVSIIGQVDGGLSVTKAPVILHDRSVRFHIARGNELARIIAAGGGLTMLVDGPQSYISPAFYASPVEVPTWNYILVQCRLAARLVTDEAWYREHHDALVERFERHGWRNELPDAYRQRLYAMMVGVEARIESFEAKFKIGQDYSDEDFRGVHRALTAADPASPLARWMRELYGAKLG